MALCRRMTMMRILIGMIAALTVAAALAQESATELNIALADIKEIRIKNDAVDSVTVDIELKLEPAYRMMKFTEANVGKKITLRVNGQVFWKDIVVREKIAGGTISFTNDSLGRALQEVQALIAPAQLP
jgi:hypothetical protein